MFADQSGVPQPGPLPSPALRPAPLVALLHNPGAGQQRTEAEAVLALLHRHGLPGKHFEAGREGLAQALAAAPELLLLAGGDGTVRDIATMLPPAAPPVAILPTGTANNIARWLRSWSSPADFARRWREGSTAPVPFGLAQGSGQRWRFLEAVGFGPFARAVELADGQGLNGVSAGRGAFRQGLIEAAPASLSLIADGEALTIETLFVEVMNIGLLGPNLPLAPALRRLDDRLALVWLPPARLPAMLDWLAAPEAAPAPVEHRLVRSVTVCWPKGSFAAEIRLDDQPREAGWPEILTLRRLGRHDFFLPPGAQP